LKIYILQCSLGTPLNCGGIFINHFIAQFHRMCIIIIIIRRAPSVRSSACCQKSPQRLIQSSSIASSKVRLCRARSFFRVAIQEV